MKKFIVFGIVAIGFVILASFSMIQNQIPYLSTKLSPYSSGLDIIPTHLLMGSITLEKYAKIETGFEDFQMYIGTAKQGNVPLYWLKTESSKGNNFHCFDMSNKMDVSSNTCRDTFRYDRFNNNSVEIILHLSTDEIQYIWLDENKNKSEKAIFIPLYPPLKEGEMFPDLTVEQLNGEKLSFSDLNGKTVVINWWATYCGNCIAEMPGFNKLVEQYKQNPNILFVAIAYNKKEDVARFLKNIEFNYIQTLANEESVNIFGIAQPVNVIVNSAGKICHYSKGGHPDKYLEIEKIVNILIE